MCWFDIRIHCKMITTIVLANTSISSYNSHFFFCGENIKIYSFSNVQVYNTVLSTTVSMLYIRSPEPICLITGICTLWSMSPHLSPQPPSPPQLLVATVLHFVSKANFNLFFFFGCGILVLQPGIEPCPSAVKAQSPNHWTAREFPSSTFLDSTYKWYHTVFVFLCLTYFI